MEGPEKEECSGADFSVIKTGTSGDSFTMNSDDSQHGQLGKILLRESMVIAIRHVLHK